jgi:DeoR/GlpR family transcriptional regulator of sugar metabolism
MKAQMKRIQQLEGLLIEKPCHLVDLAEVMDVSRDTVRRDITVLIDAGSDVSFTGEGWFARRTVFNSNLKLNGGK